MGVFIECDHDLTAPEMYGRIKERWGSRRAAEMPESVRVGGNYRGGAYIDITLNGVAVDAVNVYDYAAGRSTIDADDEAEVARLVREWENEELHDFAGEYL